MSSRRKSRVKEEHERALLKAQSFYANLILKQHQQQQTQESFVAQDQDLTTTNDMYRFPDPPTRQSARRSTIAHATISTGTAPSPPSTSTKKKKLPRHSESSVPNLDTNTVEPVLTTPTKSSIPTTTGSTTKMLTRSQRKRMTEASLLSPSGMDSTSPFIRIEDKMKTNTDTPGKRKVPPPPQPNTSETESAVITNNSFWVHTGTDCTPSKRGRKSIHPVVDNRSTTTGNTFSIGEDAAAKDHIEITKKVLLPAVPRAPPPVVITTKMIPTTLQRHGETRSYVPTLDSDSLDSSHTSNTTRFPRPPAPRISVSHSNTSSISIATSLAMIQPRSQSKIMYVSTTTSVMPKPPQRKGLRWDAA